MVEWEACLYTRLELLDKERKFGSQVSDCQFKDTDGVTVIASLYLDREGNMYELDMWKTDFSPFKGNIYRFSKYLE